MNRSCFLIGIPGPRRGAACLAWQPRLVWVLAAAAARSARSRAWRSRRPLVFLPAAATSIRSRGGLGLSSSRFSSHRFADVAALVTLWSAAYGAQGIVRS